MKSRSFVANTFAVLAIGIACGWMLRPATGRLPTQRVILPSTHENEVIGEGHRDADSSPAKNELPKPFATRLNEILSTGNHIKQARAVAAIADDLDLALVRAALDELVRAGGFPYTPIDIPDMSLTNDVSDPRKYVFAPSTTITPNSSRLLDGNSLHAASATNTHFDLTGKGGDVFLCRKSDDGIPMEPK